MKITYLFDHFSEQEHEHHHDLDLSSFLADHSGETAHARDHHHDNEEIPFCQHTCCTGLIYVSSLCMEMNFGAGPLFRETINPYSENFSSHYFRSIWQPPKIS